MQWSGFDAIIHDDSLNVMRDVPDRYFDVVITDPPYGIDIAKSGSLSIRGSSSKVRKFEPSDWDKKPEPVYFEQMLRVSKNQIIFGGNYFTDVLPPSQCWIVWDKKEGLPAKSFSDAELIWTSFKGPIRVFRCRQHGFIRDSKEERVAHPCQKPLDLLLWIMQNYTAPGDKVLDPFLGSGTTAVAAKLTGRCCVGIESNIEYVKIARERVARTRSIVRKYF